LANIPAFYALGQIVFSAELSEPLVTASLIGEVVLLVCYWVFLWRKSFEENTPTLNEQTEPFLFEWVLPVLLFALIAGALTPASWMAFISLRAQTPVSASDLINVSENGKNVSLGIAALACVSLFFIRDTATIQKGGCVLPPLRLLPLAVSV
jgi:hypothetical protein